MDQYKHAKPIIIVDDDTDIEPQNVIPKLKPRKAWVDSFKDEYSDDDGEIINNLEIAMQHIDFNDAYFWQVISKFEWQNSEDRIMDKGTVTRTFNGLRQDEKEFFRKKYDYLFDELLRRLEHDGVFRRCKVNDISTKDKVVSHMIALGLDSYSLAMESPDICEFFIENHQCQNFDAMLPDK